MSEIELKPCPFCGGPADQQNYVVEAVVHCTACCAVIRRVHARDVDTGVDASALAWNTRAPQWQPIETAPKDGTPVLLCCMSPSEYQRQRVGYMAVCGYDDGGWPEFNRYSFPATHWQPLPAPPGVSA